MACTKESRGAQQITAYNMVNLRVIQRERSLCSLNENSDVARKLAAAERIAALRAHDAVAQNQGMKDKTGGSMWVPF